MIIPTHASQSSAFVFLQKNVCHVAATHVAARTGDGEG
jgi:hypothetical protein